MKNKYSFYMGLAYANSIILGVLFLIIGIAGTLGILVSIGEEIFNFLFSSNNIETNNHFLGTLLKSIFILICLIIGMFSVGSYKKIELNLEKNNIKVGTMYFFIFFKPEEYKISAISKLKIMYSNGNYSAEGGFLFTAKNSFRKKSIDLFFYNEKNKSVMKIEDISSIRLEKLIEILKERTVIEIKNNLDKVL